MNASMEIKGLKELNKELKKLPKDIRTKTLNFAVGKSARMLRDLAIQMVPVDTGNLKSAIVAGLAPKRERVSQWESKYRVKVKPKGKITVLTRGKSRRSNSTYYARMVEEGTSKMPARPFMRPAFQLGRGMAVQMFSTNLNKRIIAANKKIGRIVK